MKQVKTDTSAKPGRPVISSEKKTLMRREIADAAKKLFQEDGYSKVSMRRIAGEVGCSPMTLYTYYDAKIDILRTLWADVFSDLFDQLEAMPKNGDNQLLTLSTAYVQYWLGHTEYYRLVFIADGVTQSDVSAFISSPKLAECFNIFAGALTQSSRDIEPEALKLRLDTLICVLNGIAHNLITISGYAWSDADRMVAMGVRAVSE